MTEPIRKGPMVCKRCLGDLLHDDKRVCNYCPSCNPLPKEQPKPEVKEKRYVDVKLTEGRVKELIQQIVPGMIMDKLEDWYIQKPPVTKDEVDESIIVDPEQEVEIADWRTRAKELGISLYHKKKEDVLEEIKLKELNNAEENKEED